MNDPRGSLHAMFGKLMAGYTVTFHKSGVVRIDPPYVNPKDSAEVGTDSEP